jgi:AGCS family alanine or glycine:cation symporter
MGSAAIPAASAATDSPARQGYVNMTGVFFDTTVICTVTGLCICASGVLGTADASGGQVNGVALTALAFKTVLGPLGGLLVSLGIVLFAFSTILGWEFCGETAFAFLFGRRAIPLYRILFALAAFLGATQSLEVVWNLSDIFNALMAVPNLISLLLLSGTAARELEAFQPEIRRGRRLRQRRAVRRAL